MAVDRSLGFQITNFTSHWHSLDGERATLEVGGVHFEAVWVLAMRKEDCKLGDESLNSMTE
jgi:hypothetical protein